MKLKLFQGLCMKKTQKPGCTKHYMTSHSDVVGMWHLKDNLFSLLPSNKEPASQSLNTVQPPPKQERT